MHREHLRRELEREWEWIEHEEKKELADFNKLEEDKKKIVAEWVTIEEAQREYNRKRESFEKVVQERFVFLALDDVVSFNVGGQLYKSTVRVWTRDRFSILAQLCTSKPKLPKLCLDEDAYFFDRDAWIFQFIYAFLRDNVLPDAIDVLRELYCEASFYRIGLLRHAIEAKMTGDEALISSPAFSRNAHGTGNTGAIDKRDSNNKVIDKKDASGGERSSSPTKSNSARFHELPDPFGFTSKK